jgi:AraC-like DNA-binding protein
LPFLEFNESSLIKKMLDNSYRGISFEIDDQLISKIVKLTTTSGMDKILKFLSILDDLSKKQLSPIAPNTFHNVVSKKSEMRINKVCLFIQNNFYHKMYLKESADLIHLTESNFCKFFKKATGKTYSDYVNEIRINETCRLLIQTDKTVSQISFECGFETLSYFNRVFLYKKEMTPSVYRKMNTN